MHRKSLRLPLYIQIVMIGEGLDFALSSLSLVSHEVTSLHTLPPLTLPLWIFVCNLSCAPAPQTSEVVEADHNNPSELTSATANSVCPLKPESRM